MIGCSLLIAHRLRLTFFSSLTTRKSDPPSSSKRQENIGEARCSSLRPTVSRDNTANDRIGGSTDRNARLATATRICVSVIRMDLPHSNVGSLAASTSGHWVTLGSELTRADLHWR